MAACTEPWQMKFAPIRVAPARISFGLLSKSNSTSSPTAPLDLAFVGAYFESVMVTATRQRADARDVTLLEMKDLSTNLNSPRAPRRSMNEQLVTRS